MQTFVGKVMSLLFNMLSRFIIVFFFSSKEQVSFNFMAVVTICSDFGAQENKISLATFFISEGYFHWVQNSGLTVNSLKYLKNVGPPRFFWVYPVGFTEFLESVGLCLLPNSRNSAIIYLILSQFHPFFFLWDSNDMNVRFFFLNSPQVSVAPFIFFFQCIFSLFFRLSSFCYPIFKFTVSFFWPLYPVVEPIYWVFSFTYYIFQFNISISFFL